MPATTRASTRMSTLVSRAVINSATQLVHVDLRKQENIKWTKLEERALLKMTRQQGLSEDEIARNLHRSVPAVRYRLAKIFHEHLDGRTDAASIREVSDWILPEHHYT